MNGVDGGGQGDGGGLDAQNVRAEGDGAAAGGDPDRGRTTAPGTFFVTVHGFGETDHVTLCATMSWDLWTRS